MEHFSWIYQLHVIQIKIAVIFSYIKSLHYNSSSTRMVQKIHFEQQPLQAFVLSYEGVIRFIYYNTQITIPVMCNVSLKKFVINKIAVWQTTELLNMSQIKSSIRRNFLWRLLACH